MIELPDKSSGVPEEKQIISNDNYSSQQSASQGINKETLPKSDDNTVTIAT